MAEKPGVWCTQSKENRIHSGFVLASLFALIWLMSEAVWATERNPDSRMPPFGRHGILDQKEIDLVVEYLYTL